MKYIKYIFYGVVALIAIVVAEKNDVGFLTGGESSKDLSFGVEHAYADTTETITNPAPYGGN